MTGAANGIGVREWRWLHWRADLWSDLDPVGFPGWYGRCMQRIIHGSPASSGSRIPMKAV